MTLVDTEKGDVMADEQRHIALWDRLGAEAGRLMTDESGMSTAEYSISRN